MILAKGHKLETCASDSELRSSCSIDLSSIQKQATVACSEDCCAADSFWRIGGLGRLVLRTGEVSMTRRRGIAKWLNRLKGFGFIEADNGCADVFTHYAEPENNGFDGLYHLVW